MALKSDREKKNDDYLDSLLGDSGKNPPIPSVVPVNSSHDVHNMEYQNININILPSGRFYKQGTKVMIRAAKVSEIQAYSMVDDNNFVDITDKMNELLSRNIRFFHPDGTPGSYKDIKDSDRIFLVFMIRELTFQGGNTLTKEVTCDHCGHEFVIPFRATPSNEYPSTFDIHQPNEKIEKFYNKDERVYELVHKDVSWKLAPPTIGIQEDFYEEIRRNVQSDKKPDVVFMKVMPFLLYNRPSITEEGIKAKYKDFQNDISKDLTLSQGINAIINNMTVGIKGLKMKCPECSTEVYTDLTFPGGASTLFEIPNILDQFGK